MDAHESLFGKPLAPQHAPPTHFFLTRPRLPEEIIMPSNVNRRDFLRTSAAAGVAGSLAASALAEEKSKPEPLRVGVVGTGRRGRYLLSLALRANVEIPALCDIRQPNLDQAVGMVAKSRGGRKPDGYAKGPKDYQRMLQRDDLDAIIVSTGMQLHAAVAIDAMRAGKHVLSEVSGAMTMDECWGLVRAERETGKLYMLAENCSYWHDVMMIQQMVQQGVFGETTYAECGYVHDCRYLEFEPDGTLTWRGEMVRDWAGNNYPTHSLGPVAQWMGINRGDRMVSLVSMGTGTSAHRDYVKRHFPKDHPVQQVKFEGRDSVSTLIKTARGALIDLRYDIASPRPLFGPYYALQGVKASYDTRFGKHVWIEGQSKREKWDPIEKYAEQYEDPLWKKLRDQAKGTGHGGGDFFVIQQFIEAVRSGGPSPIGAVDSAAWSSILPLSHKSIVEGSTVQPIPDFSEGKWESKQG